VSRQQVLLTYEIPLNDSLSSSILTAIRMVLRAAERCLGLVFNFISHRVPEAEGVTWAAVGFRSSVGGAIGTPVVVGGEPGIPS